MNYIASMEIATNEGHLTNVIMSHAIANANHESPCLTYQLLVSIYDGTILRRKVSLADHMHATIHAISISVRH